MSGDGRPRDPLAALLATQGPASRAFPPSSRYHGLGTRTLGTAAGPVVYLERRFVPPPERFADLTVHTVTEGERLDHVAARHLGDPEQFWQLADANRALQPEELTAETGRKLRVTLPAGIPGPAPGEG